MKLNCSINFHLGFDELSVQTDNVCQDQTVQSGPVFTNHSLERSLSYSPDFSMF